MTQSARSWLRRRTLDHTAHSPSDVKREFKQNKLKSHRRPMEQPPQVGETDAVQDRARTEEQ